MFEFDLRDDFKDALKKISKKNPVIGEAIRKKIKEIISRDKNTINQYKNLRYDFKNYKRVHITKRIIMFFNVDYENNVIYFTHLKHRDDAYKR
jgi:mRNA-degrading endonuclease RelE of RelBE toxin-antitoxin system